MLYPLIRPFLFTLDPERAHHLALSALDATAGLGLASLVAVPMVRSPVRLMGVDFPNRVGLAAGLDKNGEHVDALAKLGFGFLEVGTVTPRPQAGNPRPRLFRIPQAGALVNRMGFNNVGVDRMLANLRRASYRGVLGINVGKNFDTPIERAVDDYLHCLRKVHDAATYVVVNVSSPNTRDLRRLERGAELEALLGSLTEERTRLAERSGRRVPLVIKISPDLAAADMGRVAELLVDYGIDAVIGTNTTLSREGVEGLRHADETGGLSGAPLRRRATEVVRRLAAELKGQVPVIGVGGIMSGRDAAEKVEAGAALVQLYSGLVYRGPRLVGEAARALARPRTDAVATEPK